MAITLFVLAYAFYLAGFIGIMKIVFGFVLDGSLVLQGGMDTKTLKFFNKSSSERNISHLVAFILVGVAAIAWLGANIPTFNLVLSLILIFWAYSLYEIIKSWRRKKRNEQCISIPPSIGGHKNYAFA